MVKFRQLFSRSGAGRAGRAADGSLREFVYLDETSVTSLVASKTGAVAEQFVANQSQAVRAEIESSIEGGLHGVGKGKAGARGAAERTTGSQVIRRAVIQSTFRELREAADASLLMDVPRSPPSGDPEPETLEGLRSLLKAGDHHGWAVSSTQLTRGALLEIEVDLHAEQQFQTQAAIDAMVEILTTNPELFDGVDASTLGQVRGFQRIFTYLLGDLVPLQGTAVDWVVLTVPEGRWLIRRSLLDRLDADAQDAARPLSIVGVAQAGLFWKDIHRVLFDDSRFTVYCRVGKSGLQSKWQPVKLLEVLSKVAPSVARSLELGVSEFLGAFQDGLAELDEDGEAEPDLWDVAADQCSALLTGGLSNDRSPRSLRPPRPGAGDADEFEKGVDWLNRLAKEESVGLPEVDADRIVRVREKVMHALGLLGADGVATPVRDVVLGPDDRPFGDLLDVEFVAVYW